MIQLLNSFRLPTNCASELAKWMNPPKAPISIIINSTLASVGGQMPSLQRVCPLGSVFPIGVALGADVPMAVVFGAGVPGDVVSEAVVSGTADLRTGVGIGVPSVAACQRQWISQRTDRVPTIAITVSTTTQMFEACTLNMMLLGSLGSSESAAIVRAALIFRSCSFNEAFLSSGSLSHSSGLNFFSPSVGSSFCMLLRPGSMRLNIARPGSPFVLTDLHRFSISSKIFLTSSPLIADMCRCTPWLYRLDSIGN